MMKKVICCVHDKKSDVFEGFMAYNNTNEALRSFEMTCQQNETFKKWPEDFQLVLVGTISYENGEIDLNNEVIKQGKINEMKTNIAVLAEAKDFVNNIAVLAEAKDFVKNEEPKS